MSDTDRSVEAAMGACPRPDRPKRISRISVTVMHHWDKSGVDRGRFREMATNGSAWGQASDREMVEMAPMAQQGKLSASSSTTTANP
jgi:hypothetical protein